MAWAMKSENPSHINLGISWVTKTKKTLDAYTDNKRDLDKI